MLKAFALFAPRPFGYWRVDIETGHFFGTEDVHAIFDLPYTPGVENLVEIRRTASHCAKSKTIRLGHDDQRSRTERISTRLDRTRRM